VPAVDVIVPCYNYGRFLPHCVASVLGQDDCDVRVLVIDDASTDGSREIARTLANEDRRITAITHDNNEGHIATYNEGIDWVTSDYMLLLSADDMSAPGALGRATKLMQRHPNVGFVYGRALQFTEESEINPHIACGAEPSAAIRPGLEFAREICAKPVNPVDTCTAVVRTDVQKRIGGYRPELPHAGDMEMWMRFAANGDVGVVDAVQGFSRIHATNMRHAYTSNRMLADFEQRRKAFRLFFASPFAVDPTLRELSAIADRSLADEIVQAAARAFEDRSAETVEALTGLAKRICPTIVQTRPWRTLAVKRTIGYSAWHAAEPTVDMVRHIWRGTSRRTSGW
jgi:glycosyltransferase involved in cell wall biosynthesis